MLVCVMVIVLMGFGNWKWVRVLIWLSRRRICMFVVLMAGLSGMKCLLIIAVMCAWCGLGTIVIVCFVRCG